MLTYLIGILTPILYVRGSLESYQNSADSHPLASLRTPGIRCIFRENNHHESMTTY